MNVETRTSLPDRCRAFRDRFQDYLDGNLPKSRSLEVFLHVRDCAGCRDELERLQRLYALLDNLEPVEPAGDFDEAVLAEVPYAAYRQMAALRQDRVAQLLDEEFLPGFVRATATRWSGGVLAVLAGAGMAVSWLPESALAVVAAGLLPEALVRLQHWGRRLLPLKRRSQAG
jgi:anti-sigma factor RsiW